ncbi:MAG: hypothetical protein R2761_11130 [Acidimicrobiales bacterium]
MRSKSFLAVVWAVATVVAVAIVWQSLGFVSTRTEDDGDALGGGSPTSVVTGSPAGGATVPTAPTTAVTDPGTAATPDTSSTTSPTASTTVGAGVPADAVDQTFELVGGTAVVRYSSTGVTVLYAVPADGFQSKIEREGTGMKVEFRSRGHRSRVDVWWDNGPQHSVEEEAED